MRQVAVVLACLAFTSCAGHGDGVAVAPDQAQLVLVPVTFADNAVTPAVADECQLDQRIPMAVIEHGAVPMAMTQSAPVSGDYLQLHVAASRGEAGGIFSGQKALALRGTLYRNGTRVAGFEARRETLKPGGGTCGMLKKVTRKLGEDIAEWLRSPTDGARLGKTEW